MSHAYIHGDILASYRGFAAISSGGIPDALGSDLPLELGERHPTNTLLARMRDNLSKSWVMQWLPPLMMSWWIPASTN